LSKRLRSGKTWLGPEALWELRPSMPTGYAVSRHRSRRDQADSAWGSRAPSQRASRGRVIARPALVRMLTSPDPVALVLLVAPPGYGKSTLLAEWSEEDERDFIWLDSDGSDLAGVVRAGRARRRSFVVVLDDAQLIPPSSVAKMIRSSLPELPAGSTIAVASRTEPKLALGRLRANRRLTEVRIQHLAMSQAEAAQMLTREGVKLPAEKREVVLSATEGWPAAVYLVAAALREDPSCLDTLAGHLHVIHDYLQDEVLGALPDELRSFAVRTSVLEELSGPACDFLLEQQGSARLLDDLARAAPLLAPIEPSHERYRWHQLVRDALILELHRFNPLLEASLHRTAAAWFVQAGNSRLAIDHVSRAGDSELAEELIWRNVVGFASSGRNHLVHGWLTRLGRERIGRRMRLALSAALSSLTAGDLNEAQRWLTAAAAAAERSEAAGPEQRFAAELAAADVMTSRTGVTAIDELATLVQATEPRDSQWRPLCLLLKGMADYLKGGRGAVRLLEESVVLGGDCAPAVASLCLAQLGMIALEEKDWERAEEVTDRAMALTERLGREPICALVYAAAAASRAHRGRVDEAKMALRTSVDLLTSLGNFVPWYGAEARILLAHASLSLADIVRARALLAEASRLARRTPDAVIFGHWFDDAWAFMDTLAETSLAGPSALTIAELRVLRFLPSHRSFREIAAQLGVSANTVKTQAHAVYRKLGAASRSEAVARASDAGLLVR
jgi:LuxR family transcriptional regulator, maltose regulon positive regulatory protein